MLEDDILHELNDFGGKTACLIRDMDAENEILSFHADERLVSASTIKVGILLSVLERLKSEGRSPRGSFLSVTEDEICDDTEVFEYGPRKASVYELLYWMITNSDNTATNVLISWMGFDAINAWLSGHGLTESRVERKMLDFDAVSAGKNNYISAGDLYRMFCMALRMEQDGDGLPLDLLKENRDDTLLRRYLYEGYPAAHKSGQLDDVLHDAGVIFDRRGRIFIAVMLTGFPPEKMHEAEKLIGRIARMTEDSRIR